MSDTVPEQPAATKVCPTCAEPVRAAAKMCRYCGHHFDDPAVDAPLASTPSRTGAIVATIAGALLVVGSFLPWAVYGFDHLRQSGMDYRGGVFILVLGTLTIVVGVAGLARLKMPNLTGLATIAAGSIAAVLGVWEFARISTRLHTLRALAGRFGAGHFGPARVASRLATGHIAIGLWAVVAGAVLAIIAGFIIQQSPPDASPAARRTDADQPAPVSV